VATWSPQGKLFQVEYARESVKQGSCTLGLVSQTHAVLVALKRSHHDLSSHQEKLFEIDSNMGVGIAGLTSDARALATYMRVECLNYRFSHGAPMLTGRLVGQVADKHQRRTMASWKRPYGVGLLVAGYDRNVPHLYETDPSGVFSEYKAFAIGSRSQSARTYFERHVDLFELCSVEELVTHGLRALQASANDTVLTVDNTSVAVVGKDSPFEILSNAKLEPFVAALKAERASLPPQAMEEEAPAEPPQPEDEPQVMEME